MLVPIAVWERMVVTPGHHDATPTQRDIVTCFISNELIGVLPLFPRDENKISATIEIWLF